MAQAVKKDFMFWIKWVGAVGGSLVILATVIGGLSKFAEDYHARFAKAEEFKQLGKVFSEFTKTTRIGDKKAERREVQRDIGRIKRDAHGRELNKDEADSIRTKEGQIEEISEDIADLKDIK